MYATNGSLLSSQKRPSEFYLQTI